MSRPPTPPPFFRHNTITMWIDAKARKYRFCVGPFGDKQRYQTFRFSSQETAIKYGRQRAIELGLEFLEHTDANHA